MEKSKIVIEGNIGSGKSTIIQRLCQDLCIPVFLEPLDDWKEWLTLFYQDPERWGMSFNTHVLLTFSKWKDNQFPAFYERSPVSNRFVFTSIQHQQGKMQDIELKLFESIYDNIAWTPDLIIYIKTDPEVSMERMIKRGRQCEMGVPLEYLKAVHDRYEAILNNPARESKDSGVLSDAYMPVDKRQCRIKIIDGNQEFNEVLAYVKHAIAAYLNQCK